MRKLIFILFCFFFGKISSQTFSVGDMSCNYQVANYTLSGPCIFTSTPMYVTSSYSIDVDADLISDIEINQYCTSQVGSVSNLVNSIFATSSNSVECVFKSTAGCMPPNFMISDLPGGLPLNTGLTWSVLSPTISSFGCPSLNYYPTIYHYLYNSIGCSFSCGAQTSSFYVGFRKVLSNDTIYGWVLIDSNLPGKVISYGYECGGSTRTEKIDPDNKNCIIFPNPNNGEFQIKGSKEETIFITNELGQIVEEKKLNSENNYSVKINDLPNGIYFVGRQKIVVIR